MKKKIITIGTTLLVVGTIGIVLANNKAKIDKAAHPVKESIVVPVKVTAVKDDTFSASFNLNGTTAPSKEVKVASEVEGKLVALYIKNGDIVRAGQVIATLDASVFSAQLSSLQTSIEKAELDMDRYNRLIAMGGASTMQLENVTLQHKSLLAEKKDVVQKMSHMQIRAPFSGKIENVKVERGSFVAKGTVLSDLLDISSLKINVYLSEQEAFTMKPGQVAEINSPVLSNPVKGTITTISDKADASGKFLTEVNYNNTGKESLKAGMLTNVSFAVGESTSGLSIPMNALVGTVKQGKVYVVKGSQVELRSIRTGITTSDKVQVLEGLQAGEQVVISGQLNLENGSTISINK
jgi:membrane fusion protein, multidrug efflux system